MLQSIDITFIESVMTVGAQASLYMKNSEWQKPGDAKAAVGMGAFLLLFPTWICIWLHLNHKKLMRRSYKAKFEYMYSGIHNHRSKWSKFYWPISLFRRIIFIAIPTLFFTYPFFQLQTLIFFSTIYIISYAGIRPHWDNRRTRLEIFNEVMIMFFNYHLLIFTDFCTNPRMQFAMGFSYCVFIGIVVLVNISFMISNTIEKSKRKNKLKKLKAA